VSLGLAYTTSVQYATRENWKRRWDQDTRELKKDLDSTTQGLADATKDKVKAEAAFSNAQAQINDQQNAIKKLEDDFTASEGRAKNLERDLSKAKTDYNALNENYKTANHSLDQMRERNAELTQIASVSRAVAHNLNVKLAEVEDDLNNTQGQVSTLTKELDDKTKDLKKHTAMVSLLRERHPQVYNELVDQKASTKYLEGVVAAVRPNPEGKQDIVVLTIGKGDGVEEGVEFIIYRGSDFICKVKTERVMNGEVSARVIAGTWNDKKLEIQPGDLAANRL
jgi:predicted  nucleic acid-binding Zn-ribbon protein